MISRIKIAAFALSIGTFISTTFPVSALSEIVEPKLGGTGKDLI